MNTSPDSIPRRKQRIRKRWTARQMYLDEFEKIWTAQAAHHPNLTDECKAADSRRHFSSAPVEVAKGPDRHMRIGAELPPRTAGVGRGPAVPISAESQRLGDLHARRRNLGTDRPATRRTADEIDRIARHPRGDRVQESAVEARARRNRRARTSITHSIWRPAAKSGSKATPRPRSCGKSWATTTKNSRREQVGRRCGRPFGVREEGCVGPATDKRYGIAPAKAEQLADVTLEPNYASLSREAMRKLLPLMEKRRLPRSRKRGTVYGEYAGRRDCGFAAAGAGSRAAIAQSRRLPWSDRTAQGGQRLDPRIRQAGTNSRRVGPRLEAIPASSART